MSRRSPHASAPWSGSAQFLEDALAPFSIPPFDDPSAIQAAKVRSHLERKGLGIGPYNTLIAGQSLSIFAGLVTGKYP